MKSKTSCFNKCIFMKNMTHYWPVWTIVLLYHALVLPFGIYINSVSIRRIEGFSMKQMDIQMMNGLLRCVEIFINPVIIFIFSIAVAIAIFSYLYQPKAANMIHAMPVTRKELFITNYISGLCWLLIPQAIAVVAAILVSAACGYTSLVYLLQGLCYAAGLSFFFYSMCVFTAMFTGQVWGLPFFVIALNFLFIGGRAVLTGLIGMISYGMTGTYQPSVLDVLSPLYYLIGKVGITHVNYETSYDLPVYEGLSGGNAIAGYCAVAVVFIVAAYFVYKKRKIETAGSLVSITWVQPVFRWGFTICGAAGCSVILFAMLSGLYLNEFALSILSCILFGIVSFFIAQMLLEKSFSVFRKKRIIECGGILALLVLFIVAIDMNLFGQETRIPALENVEKAYVTAYYTVGGREEGQIKEVIDIHQQIIDSKEEFTAYNQNKENNTTQISIRYVLKNDKVLERRYYVIPADKEQLKDPDSVYGKIMNQTVSEQVYMSNTFGVNYKDVMIQGGSMELVKEDGSYFSENFSTEGAEALYQAVLKDLKAGNMDDVIRNSYIGDEVYQSNTYYNTIYLEYYCKDGIVQPMDDVYSMREKGRMGMYYSEYSKSGGAGVSFDDKCTNIIEELIRQEIIKDKSDLIKIEDKNESDKMTQGAKTMAN